MGLFDRFAQLFGDWYPPIIRPDIPEPTVINSATDLPTVGGVGTPDIAGNLFGIDLSRCRDHDWHYQDRWDTASFDDIARRHDDWASGSNGGGHDPWRD